MSVTQQMRTLGRLATWKQSGDRNICKAERERSARVGRLGVVLRKLGDMMRTDCNLPKATTPD